MKDLISMQDLDSKALAELVVMGQHIASREVDVSSALRGKIVGLHFSKPSTRTRTSTFAVVHRMGGTAIIYNDADLQRSTGESLKDTGMSLSLYIDAFVSRTNGSDEDMRAIAAGAERMPVINALSKSEHPTQAIADLITMRQEFGALEGLRVLYLGAWNNTAASLVLALAKLPNMQVTIVTPAHPLFAPCPRVLEWARSNASMSGSSIVVSHDPASLPAGVDVLYTTRWRSMGEEPGDPDWLSSFDGFKVTEAVMRRASHPRTIFMHDLPAHRGSEVEPEVIDGARSRIQRQAFHKMTSAMTVLHRALAASAK